MEAKQETQPGNLQPDATSDEVAVTHTVTMEDVLRIMTSLASEVRGIKNELLMEKGSSSPAPSDPRRSSIYVKQPISATLQVDPDKVVNPAVIQVQKEVTKDEMVNVVSLPALRKLIENQLLHSRRTEQFQPLSKFVEYDTMRELVDEERRQGSYRSTSLNYHNIYQPLLSVLPY